MRPRLAIVGIFYDGYYDLWEDFLELFSKNWSDCPYDLYIVNNIRDLGYSTQYNVKVLHAGKDAEYSRKVQTAIELIDADYFLLLLEDFLVLNKIVKDPICDILTYMQFNNIKYYRMQMPEFSSKQAPQNGPQCISEKSEYTVSCQPSIWERSFLQECIGSRNYNAWIFEGIYSYADKAHSKEFLNKCRVDYSNPLGLRHLAVQGKLIPEVYNDFIATGYSFKTKRELFSTVGNKRHRIKQTVKRILPLRAQRFIKKHFHTNSVIEKYKDDILTEMNHLGIE